jgi:hypothetical protein
LKIFWIRRERRGRNCAEMCWRKRWSVLEEMLECVGENIESSGRTLKSDLRERWTAVENVEKREKKVKIALCGRIALDGSGESDKMEVSKNSREIKEHIAV